MSEHITPMVGVGVFVVNEKGQFLLGKRIKPGVHGFGEFSPPGGHVEIGETPEEAGVRETLEETGLQIKFIDYCFIPWATNSFPNNKHYVTLFICAKIIGGELKNMEPHKCEGWNWYGLDDISSDITLFPPVKVVLNDPRFKFWIAKAKHIIIN